MKILTMASDLPIVLIESREEDIKQIISRIELYEVIFDRPVRVLQHRVTEHLPIYEVTAKWIRGVRYRNKMEKGEK